MAFQYIISLDLASGSIKTLNPVYTPVEGEVVSAWMIVPLWAGSRFKGCHLIMQWSWVPGPRVVSQERMYKIYQGPNSK